MGLDGVRYALWDMTGWHRDYDPCVWRNRATEEQKRVGWEMWVRMEKIIATVLREAHRLQIEEAMDTFAEGPEGFASKPVFPRRCRRSVTLPGRPKPPRWRGPSA